MSLAAQLRTPAAILSLLVTLARQRRFLKRYVSPTLDKTRLTNDGSLDHDDFRKILQYYGLAVPAVLGEAFCALHSKNMSSAERKTSTCQGAMTGLFDDFFDKTERRPASIEAMLASSCIASDSNEELFLFFFQNALDTVPDKTKMLDALNKVHEAQTGSMKQVSEMISIEEISNITFEKGGTSLLFYRTAFSPHPSKLEEKLLYQLGAMMQLANDIFDVYKDREKGIRTLVTETNNIDEIVSIFKDGLSNSRSILAQTGFAAKACTRFFEILSLAIFSRAMVCLHQLKQLQIRTGGSFTVQQYSRKDLICDMQKPGNLLRSAYYHGLLMGELRVE